MKKYYLIAIMLCWAVSSFAQYRESDLLRQLVWDDEKLSILLDTRVDFQNVIDNRKRDDLNFVGQTFRIWLVGEVVPGFRYRVRHRLNKEGLILRDGYSGATDHAWLQFDAGKHWTFTVGKQSVQIGTFENDYNGADVYLGSMVFMDFNGSMTGINTAYNVAGQSFNLQITNSDGPQFASPDYDNKALALNLLWVGSLYDGKIRTRWGYGTFQHTKTRFYNWVTLGTQFNIGKLATEFDYYGGVRNIDYSYMVNIDTLGYRYVHDQSVSLHIEYNFGKWRPFVKGIWDKRFDKVWDSTAYRSLGIQFVAEYYPFTNARLKDLRFHAAYAYKNTDFRGKFGHLENGETHLLLIGTRWIFKAK